MKTRIIQDDRPPATAIATGTKRAGTHSRRATAKPPLSTQRLAAVVLASIAGILGIGALLVGAGLLWLDSAKTESGGYYASSPHTFTTTGRAIVSNGLDANAGDVSFLLDGHVGTLRLTTTPTDPGDAVFVGIARQADVAAYLDDVQRSEVRNVDFDPFNADYIPLAGNATPAPPESTDIWVASSVASGTATIEWPTAAGEWAIVAMNADGSANVDVDIAAAATVPFIFRLGLGLTIGGAVLVLGGIAGLIMGLRRRHDLA